MKKIAVVLGILLAAILFSAIVGDKVVDSGYFFADVALPATTVEQSLTNRGHTIAPEPRSYYSTVQLTLGTDAATTVTVPAGQIELWIGGANTFYLSLDERMPSIGNANRMRFPAGFYSLPGISFEELGIGVDTTTTINLMWFKRK